MWPELVPWEMWPTALRIGLGFFLGLVLGSLVSALSYRLPRRLHVGASRSACPTCHSKLGLLQLLPLVSYLLQRGKCHVCRTPISGRYPLIECLAGLLAMLIWLRAPEVAVLGFNMVLLVVVLTAIVIDLENAPQTFWLWMLLWALVAGLIVFYPAEKPAGYIIAGLASAGAAIGYGARQKPAAQSLWYGQVPLGLALACFSPDQLVHFFMLGGSLLVISEYLYQEEITPRRFAVATLCFSWLATQILARGAPL